MDTKICHTCKVVKDLEDFYLTVGYTRNVCKICFQEKAKAHSDAHNNFINNNPYNTYAHYYKQEKDVQKLI